MLVIENIHDLEIARAASERGSFSAAARELDITQPAVSQAVARLERQLGVTLFDRQESGHDAFLTEAGAVLLAHAMPALDELGRAVADLDELKGTRPIRIGMPAAFVHHYFPQGLGVLSDAVRGHAVELALYDSERLEEELRLRRLDVGLMASASEGVAVPHATFARVDSFPMTLAVRRQDAPPSVSLSMRELARRDVPIIGFSGDRFLRKAIDKVLSRDGMQLNVVAETDQIEMLYQMVAVGMGIGLSSGLVFDDAPSGIALARAAGDGLPQLNIFVFESDARAKGPDREAIGALRRLLFSAVGKREGR